MLSEVQKEKEMIRDSEELLGAYTQEYEKGPSHKLRIWDDGFGKLYVYLTTFGATGVVRAQTWEDAYECCLDEIMNDADPEWLLECAKDSDLEEGELPEGFQYRSNGVPSNPDLKEPIADIDDNERLEELTYELAEKLNIRIVKCNYV